MCQGWIKLHRVILENPIVCKDSDYFSIWCYLLLNATHKEQNKIFKGKKIILKNGQLITGRKVISKQFNISESKVQRVLKKLEIEQQIEQQTSNANRLISIVNWENYQSVEQQSEQPVNNQRTTSEQPVNTNKNDKNEKNEKNKEKDNKYNVLFDFYIEADLIHHKILTPAIKKAIDIAEKELMLDVEQMKRIINRHKKKTEETKNTDFKTKVRTLAELFGQKKYMSSSLICSDYIDEVWESTKAETKPESSVPDWIKQKAREISNGNNTI